ncbi:hypothetical protein [Aminipila terrae]|uniref:Uncharacterized protein n=1 Tax=Aminipila terrae TaxID=2697030 RepID=A0A6P1MD93_9FIRM|nr:hypothetical protein [Aminipila terrae]QHI71877.1 hypothetical protein Ami3637_05285 [Aminipila terrae]
MVAKDFLPDARKTVYEERSIQMVCEYWRKLDDKAIGKKDKPGKEKSYARIQKTRQTYCS